MLPLRDNNPTLRTPVVTYALIAANVAVWVLVQGMGAEPVLTRSVCSLGLIPGELTRALAPGTRLPLGPGEACVIGGPNWLAPLSSMFMHGGWFHLLGNMWFLHVFGNNVEDVMGRGRFLLFYLLGGFAAAAAQVLASPSSPIPMVGASGAIGGVMGAYVLLYPRARIDTLVFLGIWITRLAIPAMFMLGYWFLLQLASGALSPGDGGGVAFWAHVGGFLAGILMVPLFRDPALIAEHRLRSGIA
jgi:membrane associated rhomboid family serine protease